MRGAVAGLVLVAACNGGQGTVRFDGPVTVRFAGAPPIRAEVARTPEQRSLGLMHRASVPDGTGMIFVFQQPTRNGFWMKDTLVPLSIAYLRGGVVVSTAEMEPCRTRDCPVYPPAGEYDTAVEAPAGFFPRHGVVSGTRMTLS